MLLPTITLLLLQQLLEAACAAAAPNRTVLYDAYTGRPLAEGRAAALSAANVLQLCAVSVRPCSPLEGRRLDGSCNNLLRPPRGASLTPYRRLLPPDFGADWELRVSERGEALPPARELRTALLADGRRAHPRLNHLSMFFMVFTVGEVTSLHDTVNYVILTVTCCAPGGERDPRCQPMDVPADDPYLRLAGVRCLNLTRAITYQALGCRHPDTPLERINTVPPMLDLSLLYGHGEEAANRAREGSGGRLRTESADGRVFPPSGSPACLNNRPPLERRCHDTPNTATNAIIGANLVALWLYRNHNHVARRLSLLNPCWGDERLYRTARDINIAYFQHIFYYELMSVLLGRERALSTGVTSAARGGRHVNDYDDSLDPTVSIEYVAATRWFHTLQEGFVEMYTPTGARLGRRAVVDDTLRSGILDINGTVDGLTQGAFRQPTADNDRLLDPDMGERVLGGLQRASDVVASDIMKGRDLGLPPYNAYRRLCGREPASRFSDFLDVMAQEDVDTLRRFYSAPGDVELAAALLTERAANGAELPPTLACIMAEQLRHWRRADRFWYENAQHPGSFTPGQLEEVRKMSMARLLCDNGDRVVEVPLNAFLLPKPRNPLKSCEHIETPDLTPWTDQSCRSEDPH